MLLFRTVLMGLLSVLVVVMPVHGQQRQIFTLEKSIEYALRHNPQIRMAEKEVAKARAGVGEAVATLLPQLDASASVQHSWEIQTSTIPNFLKPMLSPLAPYIPGFDQMPDYVQIAFGLENTIRYGATLTQPLFLGGAGVAGVQIANAAKRIAEQNLEKQRQELIYQTANAFFNCLLTKELISVQEEAYNQAKANLDVVKKKYEVGMASGFDKMRAEVDVANLQPNLIAARNNHRAALTQLRTVLGLDPDQAIEVSGEFTYREDELANHDLKSLQEMALKMRPELKSFAEQKRISQQQITIARSNFLPKIFFQTDYSFLAMKDNFQLSQKDFSKGFTSAISVQIPLFHGLKNKHQYQKARLDFKMTLDSEKQIRDGILAEVEVSYNKFKEAREKYLSAQQTVELAKEALRLANLMYEEGTNTQLDVLNSQLALTQARMNYVSSLYEYQIARYQLRKSIGQLKGKL